MDIKYFKAKLEAEKERLEGELSSIGASKEMTNKGEAVAPVWEATKTLEVDTADDTELADAFEELSTNEGIINTLESQLKEVNDALDRIEKGTYGICEISGEPIEEDRLEANPAARTSKAHMN